MASGRRTSQLNSYSYDNAGQLVGGGGGQTSPRVPPMMAGPSQFSPRLSMHGQSTPRVPPINAFPTQLSPRFSIQREASAFSSRQPQLSPRVSIQVAPPPLSSNEFRQAPGEYEAPPQQYSSNPPQQWGGNSPSVPAEYGAPPQQYSSNPPQQWGGNTPSMSYSGCQQWGASSPGWGGAVPNTYSSAPNQQWGGAPQNTYSSAPGNTYSSAPNPQWGGANPQWGGNTYSSAPGNTYSSAPGNTYSSAPNPQWGGAFQGPPGPGGWEQSQSAFQGPPGPGFPSGFQSPIGSSGYPTQQRVSVAQNSSQAANMLDQIRQQLQNDPRCGGTPRRSLGPGGGMGRASLLAGLAGFATSTEPERYYRKENFDYGDTVDTTYAVPRKVHA